VVEPALVGDTDSIHRLLLNELLVMEVVLSLMSALAVEFCVVSAVVAGATVQLLVTALAPEILTYQY